MSRHDESRLLVKIATMYFIEGQKQTDIAKRLNLSQSFISRAIARCQKEGVIRISVIPPEGIYVELEKKIQEKFNIRQVICVDVANDDNESIIKKTIGSAAAHYLETRIRDDSFIGISSWSSTIRAMVDQLHANTLNANGVIQLLGGVGANGNIQATILTHTLASHLNCQSWLLPSQTIEQSVDERNRLIKNHDVFRVIEKFDDINIAIVGIGKLEPSQLLKNSGNYYDEEMLELISSRGAVGDICLRYFDINGIPVLDSQEDPVIGITLDKLKKCDHVIALASGIDKAKAIAGALRGGYVDVLITDYHTANVICEI